MKNPTFVKTTLLLVIFAGSTLLVTSCDQNKTSEDTKEIAEDRNDEKFNDSQQKDEAQFLVIAAEINLEEIQLGQLAQQKGTTAHVKELGKMMEEAHTKSQGDLAALAKKKRISIPTSSTEDAKDTYKDLSEESAEDFDKEYVNLMVSKHQDAIAIYEKASEDSKDTDIKNWANTSLPSLRGHLDHSVESQRKFDNNMRLEKNN